MSNEPYVEIPLPKEFSNEHKLLKKIKGENSITEIITEFIKNYDNEGLSRR